MHMSKPTLSGETKPEMQMAIIVDDGGKQLH